MKTKAKKKTTATQLQELKWKILSKNYAVLNQFETSDILDFLISKEKEEIDYIVEHIGMEEDYAKWETSSYASAKANARLIIRNMKRIKRQHDKLLKQLQQLSVDMAQAEEI